MKIILYSTPTCGMCHLLKNKLNEKKVVFSSVEKSDVLQKEGITHVPVLKVNDVKMNFKEALNWLQEM